MATLTCPRCARTLTVSPRAPRSLTCPQCLAEVENPSRPGAPDSQAQPKPLPVLPLDEDVQRDSGLMCWGVIALVILVSMGIFLLAFYRDVAGGAGAAMTVAGIVIVIGIATRVSIREGREPDTRWQAEQLTATADLRATDSKVIDYAPPDPHRRTASGCASGAAFTGQVILGIVLGFFGMGLAVNAFRNLGAAWIPAGLGLVLARFRSVRGLGVGLMLSIGVAVLIIGAICGGWFR